MCSIPWLESSCFRSNQALTVSANILMRELGIVKPDETYYDETENETHSDMYVPVSHF